MTLHAPNAREAADYFAGKLAFTTGPFELDGRHGLAVERS
jgi:hypothetical protein